MHNPNPTVTAGAVVAAFLEQCGVKAAFGVISIHNMPILDAFAQRGAIRFISARGEAGAGNMADAYARSTASLGVCITSTGPAAGNIAGSMVEALTAGAPVLHITGQIETPYIDKGMSYIHEAPDQLTMLKAISKAAFRVRSVENLLGTLKRAVQVALTAPTGPVSVEIPIDIQSALVAMPADLSPLPIEAAVPSKAGLDALAADLAKARRPLLWVGGGARHARAAIQRLQKLGFGVVTTTQGRGTVPEDDAGSLGAYNIQKPVEALYQTCDAMLVVGSRLRGNETLKYELKLPRPLYRIDADAAAEGRCYATDAFVCGDSALALEGLADRLEAARYKADPQLLVDLRTAHDQAVATLRDGLGPYAELVRRIQSVAGRNFNWVRDVTVSNSTWGNRELRIFEPSAGVHATGGGIGQGMPMAIGAAIGAAVTGSGRRTFCLAGDGGFILNLGELACMVQEKAPMVIVLMNDKSYGVIKNIQDAQYGGRQCYAELHTPDYDLLCKSIALPHARVQKLDDLPARLDQALAGDGPFLLEIDMLSIGGFKSTFAGPPTNTITQIPALGTAK
ncbi:thiamine pyrophosphate-binding protein [Variovorax ginsengisoli]|uniref:Thiamine pyrophosphate-binding protein n=1 Tax=Variovorax ginsengisoli TaxID=363844 RepID=A0ABT8S4J7_9BURK|nr:thiamine pyrophosphate-binding protein [Variovorax ginsengisoli]MDN8614583.1 thiamine pyrophosphate-binding protein [Variovorax ginsengisoli]MDO1533753.1 thiamine pyrophosphate-binding protein [Variovorax ginsengisoli]HET7835470.1 thiamine pyrophosphate-binding protein [Variovorax sp.]